MVFCENKYYRLWWKLHYLLLLWNILYFLRENFQQILLSKLHSIVLLLCVRSLGSPWYDYVYFNSASSSKQWVISLLKWLTKLSVLNVSHYATMNNKTSVKLNWGCFKNRSIIGRIEGVRIQSDKALKIQKINAMCEQKGTIYNFCHIEICQEIYLKWQFYIFNHFFEFLLPLSNSRYLLKMWSMYCSH